MSLEFVKERRQNNIYQPYAPVNGVCEIGDPSYVRESPDLVSEDETVCYRLDKSTCPDLGGALIDVKWGDETPNVNCVYSLDKIETNEQIMEYVRVYGKDLYFQEVIMPKVFKMVTNRCPVGVNGVRHSTCLKVLENSEVGRLCQEWAKTHSAQANLIMKEYASNSHSTDCKCINRNQDPYYKAMKSHKVMKNVHAASWYTPCRKPEKYLVPSDLEVNKNKVVKKVSAAANYNLHRSPHPRNFRETLDAVSDVSIFWDPRSRKMISQDQTEVSEVPVINQVLDEFTTSQEITVPGEESQNETISSPSYNATRQRYSSHQSGGNNKTFLYFVIPIIVIVIIVIIVAIVLATYSRSKEREEF